MSLVGSPGFRWILLGSLRVFEIQKTIFGHFDYISVLMGICGFQVGLVVMFGCICVFVGYFSL